LFGNNLIKLGLANLEYWLLGAMCFLEEFLENIFFVGLDLSIGSHIEEFHDLKCLVIGEDSSFGVMHSIGILLEDELLDFKLVPI
jgi:hypothetical protein